MISRVYIKEHLLFDEVELSLDAGLTVFSGRSGAGKSQLLDAILSLFGAKEPSAALTEATLCSICLPAEELGLFYEPDDELVFRLLKKEKARYFVGGQNLAKKNVQELVSSRFSHLNPKDVSDFDNEKLLDTLDGYLLKNSAGYVDTLASFREKFSEFKKLSTELDELLAKGSDLAEQKEIVRLQCAKIEEINPKIGEIESLTELKNSFAKKEKLAELFKKCIGIEAYKERLLLLGELLGEDISGVDLLFDKVTDMLSTAEDMLAATDAADIDEVMGRLEKLRALEKRYGGIEEALEFLAHKKTELAKLENYDEQIELLKLATSRLQKELGISASKITGLRAGAAVVFEEQISCYLKTLSLNDCRMEMAKKKMDESGEDEVRVFVGSTALSKLSSGEFTRLRLAFLCAKTELSDDSAKLLFLDEADANLSGEESWGVASALKFLAKKHQVFAISHQPQLASVADAHYLVYKENDKSFVKKLNTEGRVEEIARIVSGEKITEEAVKLAKKLLSGTENG